MLRLRSRRFAAVLVGATSLAAPLLAAPPPRFILTAEEGVMVNEAWARASPGGATTGAAYVTLMGGAQPDSLVSASTQAAASAELHETTNDKGVMKMRPLQAVSIPPGQMVTFAPGGLHIMLLGLKHPLKAGESFPLTLTFAHAAQITVDVKIRPLGKQDTPMSGNGAMHMQ